MSSLVVEASPPAAEEAPARPRRRPPRAFTDPRVHSAAVGAAVALAVAACAFVAQGGSQIERTTWTEVAVMLAGAGLVAFALLTPRAGSARIHGGLTLLAFALLAAFTALSIIWSLAPSDSWLEASRTFSYLAAMAAGVALARLARDRWPAVIKGLAVGAVAVCGWALLTKVFPAALAPDEPFARLRPPFDYWNSVGLAAAMGVFPLLWLGARRSGHAAANALAWPGIGLLLVCLMLSYSRGALLVLGLGIALWLIVVPLRLRSVAVLAGAAVAAAPVVAWAFAQDGLTRDRAPMMARTDAGQELGLLLVLLAACLLVAGLAVGFLGARHPAPPRARRNAGRVLLAALACVPIVALILLATAPGGVDGQVSKAWKQAVNPQARTPANTPSRLTATASVRARYWEEALKIHDHSKWIGTGAGSYATVRTRVRQNGDIVVRHAHGYVVQTLSDLGWAGLGLSVLAVLAWLLTAARTLGLRRRDRGMPWTAERVGLATMAVVAIVFGLHSAIDWTWFVPGNAVPALLCAGWVAGRGSLWAREGAPATKPPDGEAVAPNGKPARRRWIPRPARWRRPRWVPPPYRSAAAALVAATALVAAWAALQPLRSVHAEDAAFDRFDRGQMAAAASIAQIAHERNPLSVDPLFDLASIQQARGRTTDAKAALEQAVQTEPANAETWRRLGALKLDVLHDARGALTDFQAAYYLDPQNRRSWSDVIVATRAVRGG